jgi:hypothetical protein
MFDKQNGQHLGQLLLINNMRNLTNDISHDRSILTDKIFGATTIRLFLLHVNQEPHVSMILNDTKLEVILPQISPKDQKSSYQN